MNIIYAIESRLWIVFTICYSYQIFYMVYMLLFKRSLSERFINRDPVMHKIAVVISARNESAVIGQLIESIHAQTYPAELIRIYVCADNCTDDTAEVARAAGATVFERQKPQPCRQGLRAGLYVQKNPVVGRRQRRVHRL